MLRAEADADHMGGKAAQANNDIAREAIFSMPFFRAGYAMIGYYPWVN